MIRQHYSQEIKEQCIRSVANAGESVRDVAAMYQVEVKTLTKWMHAYKLSQQMPVEKTRGRKPSISKGNIEKLSKDLQDEDPKRRPTLAELNNKVS
jgi:transposase